MSEYSKKSRFPISPRLWGWVKSILFLGFAIAVGPFHAIALCQEFETQSPSEFLPVESSGDSPIVPNDFPRIRSLGKLVSIEGKIGDPGSLRVDQQAFNGANFTGTELPFDLDSNSEILKLPKLS